MTKSNKLPSYQVNVFTQNNIQKIASLKEAKENDILSLNSNDWHCNWQNFWKQADWDCEGIIKLTFQGKILGLIHFALYPYPYPNNIPEYLEILHLECLRNNKRLINPVGFWLIWYSTKIALKYCRGDKEGTIVVLDALEKAIDYYKNKVMMEEIGWTTIAPGEDAYAFKFTTKTAQNFCERIENKYGEIRDFT